MTCKENWSTPLTEAEMSRLGFYPAVDTMVGHVFCIPPELAKPMGLPEQFTVPAGMTSPADIFMLLSDAAKKAAQVSMGHHLRDWVHIYTR